MKQYLNDEYQDLQKVAESNTEAYRSMKPFPSYSFKNFFNPQVLEDVLSEFPDLSKGDALKYDNPKERKLAGKGEGRFGEKTKEFMHFLNSQPFLEFLQKLTGIEEILVGDPYFSGGGLHEIKKGGLLKVHADFNKHPTTHLDRRINVLVYLNKDWKEEYGGHFELWDKEMTKCEKKILPEFNTLAMFSTTDFSYHGHPNPLNCPEDMSRKSLALYYYSNGRPKEEINPEIGEHSTIFKERKGNEEDNAAFAGDKGFKSVVKDFIPPIILKAFRK